MKVKIVNALGDWKIATETGAFYPGAYPTYEDAANKCETLGFEISGNVEKEGKTPVKGKEPERLSDAESMAAMMGKMRDLPQVKIYPGRVKWDTLQLFAEGQEKRLMSTAEAAKILGVSTQHISNLIDEGRISALNIASRGALRKVWRIVPQGLLDLILKSLCATPEDLSLSDIPQASLRRLRARIDEHLTAETDSLCSMPNGGQKIKTLKT